MPSGTPWYSSVQTVDWPICHPNTAATTELTVSLRVTREDVSANLVVCEAYVPMSEGPQ